MTSILIVFNRNKIYRTHTQAVSCFLLAGSSENAANLTSGSLYASNVEYLEEGNMDGKNVVNTHCKFCIGGRYFRFYEDLKEHLVSAHNKNYLGFCVECTKCFFSAVGYKHHIDTVHSTDRKGPHCHVCGKYFSCNSRLSQHLRRHSEERQFVCPICQRSYKHKHALKEHMVACGQ